MIIDIAVEVLRKLETVYDGVRRVSGLRREPAWFPQKTPHIPLKNRIRPSRSSGVLWGLLVTSNCSQPSKNSHERVGVYFSAGYTDMRDPAYPSYEGSRWFPSLICFDSWTLRHGSFYHISFLDDLQSSG